MLSLATSDILAADQLPETEQRSRLAHILASGVGDLSPLPPAQPLTDLPEDLDLHQRDAIARGLASPDICLIQGLPGTGKSRVAAEILTRSVARGERAIVLAPGAAALDRLLELLPERPGLVPLRLLDRHELADNLPPAAAQATFAAGCRRLREATMAQTRDIVARSEAAWQGLPDESATYQQLAALATEIESTAARRAELQRPLEPDPAVARLREDAGRIAAELVELRPLADARQQGQWWTGLYWKARKAGDPTARLAELEARQAALLAEAGQRETQPAEARRTALQQLDADEARLRDRWEEVVAALASGSPRPEAPSAAGVESARQAWQSRYDAARQSLEATRQAHADIDRILDGLPSAFSELANVVFTSSSALNADPQMVSNGSPPFDLMIYEDAHLAKLSDLETAFRIAHRWILIGEPLTDSAQIAAMSNSRGRSRRVFDRLWHMLHCDPWQREEDRLVCRLQNILPQMRADVVVEPLADRPDVELRIIAPSDSDAVLAEVAFPAKWDICSAKSFVYQQLGEAPFRSRCDGFHWCEDSDRFVLQLHGRCSADAKTAELAPGVHELFVEVPGGWRTCGIAFHRSAGWDLGSAEAWAKQHVGQHDLGRAVRLESPHRLGVGLGGVVAEILDYGPYYSTVPHSGMVDFVAVPALPTDRTGNGMSLPIRLMVDHRGELNLADPRHRAVLPADLREQLPPEGIVNLAEARAVVKLLAEHPGAIVMTMTSAQAELIRRLAPGANVGVPVDFRQREAAVAIVSLVRSQNQWPVAYGEGEEWLPLSLSRGRHLILVGDTGTLSRRARFVGPVEDRESNQARRERELIEGLVRYLQGRGRFSRAFRLIDGPTS